jgi:hypothetical protein
MNPVNQQLLLVKYLYQQGEDALSERGMFSAGLAVSLFQDAVESLAWTIAKEVDADIKERDGFEGYWEAVKHGKNNPARKELPPKTKMRDLNKARVNFKHYGVIPADGEAAKLQTYSEQFMVEACKEFFGVDFMSLSAIELIHDSNVSAHLRLAEQAIAKNEVDEAMTECALANGFIEDTIETLLPPLPVDWNDLVGGQPVVAQSRLKEVEATVTTMRNFTLATSLRIPLDEFLRFKELVPSVVYHEGEQHMLSLPQPSHKFTMDDAKFAFRYLANFALTLERTIGGLVWGADKSPLS